MLGGGISAPPQLQELGKNIPIFFCYRNMVYLSTTLSMVSMVYVFTLIFI